MPREIKPPSRYVTEDGPVPQLPRRAQPQQTRLPATPAQRGRGRATSVLPRSAPSRSTLGSSTKGIIEPIVIGDDDDSDVEIIEPPNPKLPAKRKKNEEKDPDWGSSKKSTKQVKKALTEKAASQAVNRTSRTVTAPTTPLSSRSAVLATNKLTPRGRGRPPSTASLPVPKPRESPLAKVSEKIIGGDLYMECYDEPLSWAQVQAARKEQFAHEKSQLLIRAAQEGRLLFTPSGETQVLKKPYQPPKAPSPPPPPPPAPVAIPALPGYMSPQAAALAVNLGQISVPLRNISPETITAADTQYKPLGPNQVEEGIAESKHGPDVMPVMGTHGLGIKLPPWQAVPEAVNQTPPATPPGRIEQGQKKAAPKGKASESAAKGSASNAGNQPSPRSLTTAIAKKQAEVLANLRKTMQEEAKSKAQSDSQKKKDKKQEEEDESGNWVPLDEYYYGKMEGNPTYKESKGDFKFKCWYCNKLLYNNVAAMQHMQGHIDSDRQVNLDLSDLTSCKHCHKVFNTPFEMQTHVEKVHQKNTDVLLCRICEKDHDTGKALKEHMKRNHNACEMPYVCQLCGFRSSMYSDVVDHFKKKHSKSASLMCLYCLRVFNARMISQGWGQTHTYFNHLTKHQIRNCTKKCSYCKLIFLNASDLKVHRQTEHQSNQRGVRGLTPRGSTPNQVMIRVDGDIVGSSSSKGIRGRDSVGNLASAPVSDVGGIRSLNVPTVRKVLDHRLSLPANVYRVKCVECNTLMGVPDHYKKYIECSMCRFATSCSYAYNHHMLGFHSGRPTAVSALQIPADRKLFAKLYCECGFSSTYGNQIANHLVSCSKITCYKNPPPAPSEDTFGMQMQDPRKKPDACLLDVLGLVKKDELASFAARGSRAERPSTPEQPVEMPEVEETTRPAQRPSLLKDSIKRSFKDILKEDIKKKGESECSSDSSAPSKLSEDEKDDSIAESGDVAAVELTGNGKKAVEIKEENNSSQDVEMVGEDEEKVKADELEEEVGKTHDKAEKTIWSKADATGEKELGKAYDEENASKTDDTGQKEVGTIDDIEEKKIGKAGDKDEMDVDKADDTVEKEFSNADEKEEIDQAVDMVEKQFNKVGDSKEKAMGQADNKDEMKIGKVDDDEEGGKENYNDTVTEPEEKGEDDDTPMDVEDRNNEKDTCIKYTTYDQLKKDDHSKQGVTDGKGDMISIDGKDKTEGKTEGEVQRDKGSSNLVSDYGFSCDEESTYGGGGADVEKPLNTEPMRTGASNEEGKVVECSEDKTKPREEQERKVVQCSEDKTKPGEEQEGKVVQCSEDKTKPREEQEGKVVQCSEDKTKPGEEQEGKVVQCSEDKTKPREEQEGKVVQCSEDKTKPGEEQEGKVVQCSEDKTKPREEQEGKVVQCSEDKTKPREEQESQLSEESESQLSRSNDNIEQPVDSNEEIMKQAVDDTSLSPDREQTSETEINNEQILKDGSLSPVEEQTLEMEKSCDGPNCQLEGIVGKSHMEEESLTWNSSKGDAEDIGRATANGTRHESYNLTLDSLGDGSCDARDWTSKFAAVKEVQYQDENKMMTESKVDDVDKSDDIISEEMTDSVEMETRQSMKEETFHEKEKEEHAGRFDIIVQSEAGLSELKQSHGSLHEIVKDSTKIDCKGDFAPRCFEETMGKESAQDNSPDEVGASLTDEKYQSSSRAPLTSEEPVEGEQINETVSQDCEEKDKDTDQQVRKSNNSELEASTELGTGVTASSSVDRFEPVSVTSSSTSFTGSSDTRNRDRSRSRDRRRSRSRERKRSRSNDRRSRSRDRKRSRSRDRRSRSRSRDRQRDRDRERRRERDRYHRDRDRDRYHDRDRDRYKDRRDRSRERERDRRDRSRDRDRDYYRHRDERRYH